MFVTMPQFEESGMTAMAGGGQKYWRALAAMFPVEPWYLFTFEAQVLNARVNQTMLVAWEESLLDIVEGVPATDRRTVYRIQLGPRGTVAFSSVHTLWAPTDDEAGQGIGAVFGLEGESALLDSNMRPVAEQQSRRLVFRKRLLHAQS